VGGAVRALHVDEAQYSTVRLAVKTRAGEFAAFGPDGFAQRRPA
jgi:hypothetical protein